MIPGVRHEIDGKFYRIVSQATYHREIRGWGGFVADEDGRIWVIVSDFEDGPYHIWVDPEKGGDQ